MLRHQHHRSQIQFHAAKPLRKLNRSQPKLGSLLNHTPRHRMILMPDGFEVRLHLLRKKLICSSRNSQVFRRKILGRKYPASLRFFSQESAPAQSFSRSGNKGFSSGHIDLIVKEA